MVDGVEMVFSKEKMIERLKKEGRADRAIMIVTGIFTGANIIPKIKKGACESD